jgi:hypothetical protein
VRLTLLHTNDVHGEVDGLARIATLVERIRAETPHRVLYVDCGDIEETTSRLSNLAKGVAMHRLLSAAGCEAAAVGNAVWLRYGPRAVSDEAAAATYPLLCANLKPFEHVRDSLLIDGIGVVGITDPFPSFRAQLDFGLHDLPIVETVRRLARQQRADGAELVVLLSHMGLDPEHVPETDDVLARELAGDVDLILGAHSHHELPDGLRAGGVLVARAGSHAEWLGRVDVDGDGARATLIPVTEEIPPHPAVLDAVERVERELAIHLDEVIATLDQPLDAQRIAELLRRRFEADVGLAVSGAVLERTRPPGRRRSIRAAPTASPPPTSSSAPPSGSQASRSRPATSSRRSSARRSQTSPRLEVKPARHRMPPLTRREAAPASFHVQPACAADAGTPSLGQRRPRRGAAPTSSLSR